MHKEKYQPLYKIGDLVRIVDEPAYNTRVGWEPAMSDYCGMEAKITRVFQDISYAYYYIDIDGQEYYWAEDCMNPLVCELPEFDASTLDALLGIM